MIRFKKKWEANLLGSLVGDLVGEIPQNSEKIIIVIFLQNTFASSGSR